MLTRGKSRQAGDKPTPTSSGAQGGNSAPKGILKNATGEPCGPIQQPEWTGPMTRSRARSQFNGNPSGVEMAATSSKTSHQELNVRKRQNSPSRRGKQGGLSLESAPCPSIETASPLDSLYSARSCLPGPSSMTAAATAGPSSYSYGDAMTQPAYGYPLNTLSLLPRHQRLNILEAVAKAFPITVPEEEVCNYFDGREPTDLTAELKRYVLEKRVLQHRNEFERNVSVFRSESPWEPTWFTNFLTKLILTTKARPNIYQYIFDVRQREQDSTVLEKWKALNGFVKWTIGLAAMFSFIIALCFLIDTYGEEGVSFSVPLVLFVNIILNKVLVNLSGAPPSDI